MTESTTPVPSDENHIIAERRAKLAALRAGGIAFERVELAFLSPFRVRGLVRKLWQAWVNAHRWCQEFYEENLTGLVGCYEIRAVLRRRPRGAP